MRTSIATSTTAVALLFAAAGVAHATAPEAPAPTTAITHVAEDYSTDQGNDRSDKTGLWGLAGLLGLIGLAGGKHRTDTSTHSAARGATAGTMNVPQ